MTRAHLIAPLLAAATLAGCSTTIDDGKAEKLVTKAAKQVGARVKSASCPDDLTAKKGESFTCDVTGADGSTGRVLIKENDDKGNSTVASTFLRPARLEQFVSDTIHKQITPRSITSVCPDIVIAKTGDRFTCQVEGADGSKGTVQGTETDATGKVTVDADFLHTGNSEQTIARDIEKKTGTASVDVTCPAIVTGKVGQEFACEAVGGGETATVTVTQVTAAGGIRYRVTS